MDWFPRDVRYVALGVRWWWFGGGLGSIVVWLDLRGLSWASGFGLVLWLILWFC